MKASVSILLLLLSMLLLSCKAHRPAEVTFTTTMGDITIALCDETPLHRDNFLAQAESGYYDSLLFHRVIRDFVAQAGDPTSRHAAPGELIGDESPEPTVPAEICYPTLYHRRGVVAAAREGDNVNPERASSCHQFYIVLGRTFPTDSLIEAQAQKMRERNQTEMDPAVAAYYRTQPGTPHLDGGYTVFGYVTQGLDVVEAMQEQPTDANDRPLADIRILRTTVRR